MEKPSEPISVDLKQSEPSLLHFLTKVVEEARDRLKDQEEVHLIFLVHEGGKNQKEIPYTLSRTHWKNEEKDLIFPRVVREILKQEFPPKVARDPKLINQVTGELRKHPYWDHQVVDLVRTIKGKRDR